jgi:hypothetical protein
MARTRWQTLVVIALTIAAVVWIVLDSLYRRGTLAPRVSWAVAVVEVVIAAVVLVMGWSVRQYLQGRRPSLDPIRAARTAVLAKAACYTGSVLLGWYGGQVLVYLSDLDAPGNGGRAVAAAIAAGGALVLAAVGLVVEWFCRIPPPEDEQHAAAHDGTPTAG